MPDDDNPNPCVICGDFIPNLARCVCSADCQQEAADRLDAAEDPLVDSLNADEALRLAASIVGNTAGVTDQRDLKAIASKLRNKADNLPTPFAVVPFPPPGWVKALREQGGSDDAE